MEEKIGSLLKELSEVQVALSSSDLLKDKPLYKELSQKYKYLSTVKEEWDALSKVRREMRECQDLLRESDEDLVDMAKKELALYKEQELFIKKRLELLLVPPDPDDDRNCIMELRAGAGGDEATLFVSDCVRMYRLFSEKMSWKFDPLSSSDSDFGGYKEYHLSLSGKQVYRFMKYESGTHRVQRIPKTESQGRVHTSTITIAVLLEPDDEDDIIIKASDIRIDTYRSTGAGGQHVNTTDSAVRITHLPTNVVVHCQEERSQIKNRNKAMRILNAKLVELQKREREKEISSLRLEQIGSGDRSERIRTYNFPQNRVTDHRIGVTLYSLDSLMEGDMEELISKLVTYFYSKKLGE